MAAPGVCFLACLLLFLGCHAAEAQATRAFEVESVFDLNDPFALTKEAMDVAFSGEDRRVASWSFSKMKSGDPCAILYVRSGVGFQAQMTQHRLAVSRLVAHFRNDGVAYKFEVYLGSLSDREIMESELENMFGARATMGKIKHPDGRVSPIWRWDSERMIVISHQSGPELMLEMIDPSFPLECSFPIRKTVIDLSPQLLLVAAPVDLDPLLDFDKLWTLTPADLESMYQVKGSNPKVGAQFEWTDPEKKQARFSGKFSSSTPAATPMTLFAKALAVDQVFIEFVDGRAARMTLSIHTRGISGIIKGPQFRAKFTQAGHLVGKKLGVAPQNRSVSGSKIVRWIWQSPKCAALLEHDEFLETAPFGPEYLRLKLAAPTK